MLNYDKINRNANFAKINGFKKMLLDMKNSERQKIYAVKLLSKKKKAENKKDVQK